MVQVISGSFRNRRLISPKGIATRPTTSQVRQAVFNICQNEVEGSSFLDICAGSGSVGIEAISRGALHATFIENDRFALSAIFENIKALGIEKQVKVYALEAVACLKRLTKKPETYQIAYFDPPYSRQNERNHFVTDVLHLLDESTLIAPQGLLFFRRERLLQRRCSRPQNAPAQKQAPLRRLLPLLF